MAVVHLELEVPVEAISHTCRMCLAEDSASSMVAPCSCTGSQRYVHVSCLRRWQSVLAEGRVNVGRGKTCSVCRVDFALTPLAVGTESRLHHVLVLGPAAPRYSHALVALLHNRKAGRAKGLDLGVFLLRLLAVLHAGPGMVCSVVRASDLLKPHSYNALNEVATSSTEPRRALWVNAPSHVCRAPRVHCSSTNAEPPCNPN